MPSRPDYQVEVRESAAKEIRALPSEVKQRVIKAINSLSSDPHPRGSLKLKGGGSLYRIRVGVYRIVYDVDDVSRLIVITRARHRREVYD
ncbi:MAG: type II toxin-antitoxin system RelE/ParE family toxin [Armatimonadetes bacterium]|nr:type II toxin-antitoxin system RelE/ParE family toxin [Armatimonadota bacterium]